jgi:hypothetical protein
VSTWASERVALVIGNGDYKEASLTNPANDAKDIAKTLRTLNFDVIEKINLNQKQMIQAIQQFNEKLSDNTVGLFYFAGHGIQVSGENYLLPLDASLTLKEKVLDEMVGVRSILTKMKAAHHGLNIMILDACRNNPFQGRGIPTALGGHKGLARVDAPTGSLIVYATAPGTTASDGDGKNGLFTKYLLKNMTRPNLDVALMLRDTRSEVMRESKRLGYREQVPWESSSLLTRFCFAGCAKKNPRQRPKAEPSSLKKLVFGFNFDGAPISYPEFIRGERTNMPLGFCQHLARYLRQQGYHVSPMPLSIDERFEVFPNMLQGKTGVLCGPNTITAERKAKIEDAALGYSGEFSQSFMTTTAKLLMRSSKRGDLYNKQKRGLIKVGVFSVKNKDMLNTTSISIIRSLSLKVILLNSRAEALRRLQLAEDDPASIDAYLSDEIIVENMLQEIRIPQNYHVEPPNDLFGYSWENFGLVIYNEPELTIVLNKWLASPATQELLLPLIPESGFTYRCSIENDCEAVSTTSKFMPFVGLLLMILMASFLMIYRWKNQMVCTKKNQKNQKTLND